MELIFATIGDAPLKTETGEKTLLIDSKTTFPDFKDASEIKVGAEVGVRSDADYKQAFLIRSWPPK